MLLALETSAALCQVALYDDANVQVAQEQGQQHSRVVLSLVQGLLDGRRCRLADLDAIAVCVGPGSFTGLRIGVSVAQGLAYAAGLPVVPVNSLEATAWVAEQRHRASGGAPGLRVLAMLDARKSQLYCGWFDCDEKNIVPLGDLRVCDPAHLQEVPGSPASLAGTRIAIAGSGLDYADQMPVWLDLKNNITMPCLLPGAEAIAILARRHLLENGGVAPASLQPLYLRDKVTD